MSNTRRIAVFGSSKPKPDERVYRQAVQLGRLLGAGGYTVLNGGYGGIMEAVSRGAAEAGGHVIGVTCDEIEAFRPGKGNRWITELWHFKTLRERLYTLIESSDGAIVMPGGIGTLAEMAVMWAHLQTRTLSPRPLILVGPEWQAAMQAFYEHLGDHVSPAYRELLTFAAGVQEAFDRLQAAMTEAPRPSHVAGRDEGEAGSPGDTA